MSKKRLGISIGIGISVVILMVLGGMTATGVFHFVSSKSISDTTSLQLSISPSPTETLLRWDDPSGFSFQYPSRFTATSFDADQDSYAHIIVTLPENQYRATIIMKDASVGSLTQNIASNPDWNSLPLLDTTLGVVEAKKLSIANGETTLFLTKHEEFLYELSIPANPEWESFRESLITSFSFSETENTDAAPVQVTDGNEDSIEEEVVE